MTRIRISWAGEEVTATLDNSVATRDFLDLLPLTLTLDDYQRTEKISDLPGRLSTEGAPAGINPAIGDLTYYAPWGNLAIFYRDFGYAKGLVRLGTLDNGAELFAGRGSMQVRIETLD